MRLCSSIGPFLGKTEVEIHRKADRQTDRNRITGRPGDYPGGKQKGEKG